MRHYVHQISSDDNDALEFVSSVGDCVVVTLNNDEVASLNARSDASPSARHGENKNSVLLLFATRPRGRPDMKAINVYREAIKRTFAEVY